MDKDKGILYLPAAEARACAECGEQRARRSTEVQSFLYGERGKEVTLSARVPVWTCDACGAAYTDGEGEDARHEAVCRHLGLLSPLEIRNLRSKHSLTQAELAQLTGFGEASIKRWEAGTILQNSSSDKFLRLLLDNYVMRKLQGLASEIHAPQMRQGFGKFRTQFNEDIFAQAKVFELRREQA